MKNLFTTVILVIVILTSCADKIPLTAQNKIYAGKWITNDGTWLQVYNNGSGSFEKSNSSVSGGAVTFTDSTIVIGLLGIGSTYEINEAPHEENGQWTMTLDDNVYLKN